MPANIAPRLEGANPKNWVKFKIKPTTFLFFLNPRRGFPDEYQPLLKMKRHELVDISIVHTYPSPPPPSEREISCSFLKQLGGIFLPVITSLPFGVQLLEKGKRKFTSRFWNAVRLPHFTPFYPVFRLNQKAFFEGRTTLLTRIYVFEIFPFLSIFVCFSGLGEQGLLVSVFYSRPFLFPTFFFFCIAFE